MIRSESEYQEAVERLAAERKRLDEHAEAWREQGFTAEEIAKLREPLESFHLQLADEVAIYKRTLET